MIEKSCVYCLCKDCKLAYSNGGAEGCGDCDSCRATLNQKPVGICNEYIYDEKAKVRGMRAKASVIDDYREHDPKEIMRVILPILQDKNGSPFATEENIEDVLDKIFNNDKSQD